MKGQGLCISKRLCDAASLGWSQNSLLNRAAGLRAHYFDPLKTTSGSGYFPQNLRMS
jgi:hypothetical protein